MTMTPEISIIVPVYNVENYLRDCLDSILKQTFRNWECIMIDDGSVDASGDICDEYCKNDSRFTVIHSSNKGVSSARNKGLEVAVGQWLCFVDSDDRMTEDALDHMLSLNLKNKADVCICSLVRPGFRPHKPTILSEKEKRELIWACLTYQTIKYSSKGLLVDAPWAKLFRTSLIKDNNIRYVDGLCKSEDALFVSEFYNYASRIVLDPHQVYFYTVNSNSICHTYNKSHIAMLGTLLRLEEAFVSEYCDDPEFENAVKIRAFAALLQVLFESDAHKRPLADRIEALELFFSSENVKDMIKSTRYSEIRPFTPTGMGRYEFYLARTHKFKSLCRFIDMRLWMFNARVRLVAGAKKLVGINPNTSLSSFFSKKRQSHE